MRTWICLPMLVAGVAIAALPLSAMANDVTKNGPAANASALLMTVDTAVTEGDVPKLVQMYGTSKDPVARVLAAMALERIHFNLEKSSEDARICERSLIDSQPRVAFFCARFANGNLRLLDGPKQADAAELDIAKRFADRIAQPEIESLKNYASSRKEMPQLNVETPSTGLLIPVERTLGTRMRPTIEIQSHGMKTRFVVSTGSSSITLDPYSAKELGVRMLDRSGMTNGFMSRNIPVSYGVLDELTIGDITVTNAPVAVVAGRKKLIGMDLLRHFGSFRLSEKSLEIYGDGQPRPTCKEPMLLASDVWGNHLRILAALPIDGSLRTTLIDSGSSAWLTGDQSALDQLHTRRSRRINLRDMGSKRHIARVSQATAAVDIAGRTFDVTFEVFKDASSPWHYALGSGALKYMDFYFDFSGRHTCLLLHDDLH